MTVRRIKDRVIVDKFIGGDGQPSNWRLVFKPSLFHRGRVRVSLHWGDKEEPTHELETTKSVLIKALEESL